MTAAPTRAPERERSTPSALDSVTRSMALALGVGAVAFFALSFGKIVSQSAAFGPVWSWAAPTVLFGPLLVAAVLSPWLSPRTIRVLAGITAVGQFATLVTLVPALPGGVLPDAFGTPWPLGVTVLGSASAAVAWRSAVTWPYVAVGVLLVGLDRFLASPRYLPDIAIQDALHTLLFTAVFTSLALAIRRAGRQLDAASERAIADTRRLATAEAQLRERSRVEALVHDSVLVALLASARHHPSADRVAREALDRLDELEHRGADASSEPVDARTWLWSVQAATTQIDPMARFSHEMAADATPVPADVAEAIIEASAEALRNSVVHAGPASRAVHVRLGADRVEVTVIDDGKGFDIEAVGEARLGIAISIRERTQSLPGGRVALVSRPGLGTRVAIGWAA